MPLSEVDVLDGIRNKTASKGAGRRLVSDLRSDLESYYAIEGEDDTFRVEIPIQEKGYELVFVRNTRPTKSPPATPPSHDVTPPPPPAIHIARPQTLANLRRTVLAEHGNHIGLVLLHGMPGIGKSVLAQMLCEDQDVIAAFPDGIYWMTIGRDSGLSPSERAAILAREMGGVAEPEPSYRRIVRSKSILIVLDDVWDGDEVERFRAFAPGSVLLVTTRDAKLAASLGATTLPMPLLDDSESLQVLTEWAHIEVAAMPTAGRGILTQCKGHALMLSMIGAALRDKPPSRWDLVLGQLESARLAERQIDFPNYSHATLATAIAISIEALDDPDLIRRYLALAVIPEETKVPPTILQILWHVSNEEAIDCAERLVSRSLLQWTHREEVFLHSLQSLYLRNQFENATALQLIRGAWKLSEGVIHKDAQQFTSQLIGRLATYNGVPEIRKLEKQLSEGTKWPWVRANSATLHPPGTALLSTLIGHRGNVASVAVSRSGSFAISASWDGTLKLWDLRDGHLVRTIVTSLAPNLVAIDPEGRTAACAYYGAPQIDIWDTQDGRLLRTLSGHSERITSLSITPDRAALVSGSWDGTVRVWDMYSGAAMQLLSDRTGRVLGLACSTDGRSLVSVSARSLTKWDLTSGKNPKTLARTSNTMPREEAVSVAAVDDGTVLWTNGKVIERWDLESGEMNSSMEGHTANINAIAVAPNEHWVASASDDWSIKIWDLATGRLLQTFKDHSFVVHDVRAIDDDRLISASGDATIKLWKGIHDSSRAQQPTESRVISTPDGDEALFRRNDAFSLTFGESGLRAWDTETSSEAFCLPELNSSVDHFVVTPDCRYAAAVTSGKTLAVWDIATGARIQTLLGHSQTITDIAITADGRRVCSASYDGTLRLWNVDSGRCIATFHPDAVVGRCDFLDSQRIVVSDVRGMSHELFLENCDLA